ncbi:unnamed protein product, partial [Meganyctiphanes norvegica]|uniref:Exonuclease domain-containing protein n=1 Tax=Meganyctiphanes norvegica TaxID=48144 RepID=A0AAV2Q739_MEGNR
MDGGEGTSENTQSENEKIETFVFFDLETTGLRGDDPRILELSMIAVSREDLLKMKEESIEINGSSEINKISSKVISSPGPSNGSVSPNIIKSDTGSSVTSPNSPSKAPSLPRVLQKYTRLYYPRKLINPKVEELTGLNNELMHRLPSFSLSSVEAIALFLDLPKPVCLVAHNGDRYDFPLLKAEFVNAKSSDALSNVKCVDTLTCIKEIDSVYQNEADTREISEIMALAESWAMEEFEDDDLEVIPLLKRSRNPQDYDSDQSIYSCSSPASHVIVNHHPPPPPEFDLSMSPPMTPAKTPLEASARNMKYPPTPQKSKMPPKLPYTPDSKGNTKDQSSIKNVRRTLTYGEKGKKRKWDGTMPYRQENIFKRLFNGTYDAHTAEADSLALLKICGHYGDDFVNWADNNSDKFNKVDPMWHKRKSFQV